MGAGLSVAADLDHIASGVPGAFGKPVDLELGGVELAVLSPAAAVDRGKPTRPNALVAAADAPDPSVSRFEVAAQQFPDVEGTVWPAADTGRNRIGGRASRDTELHSARDPAVGDGIECVAASVDCVGHVIADEHRVRVGVRELPGVKILVLRRPPVIEIADSQNWSK